MKDLVNSIYKIRFMDEISLMNTSIHKLHPISKIIVTLIYLILVASYNKYDLIALLPLIIYPMLVFSIAEIPYKPILKRALYVSPFIIGVGIFNPIFDTKIILLFNSFKLSLGWLSFIVLVFKSMLCVICALLLIATTGMDRLAAGLRQLKVPKIFVLQLTLTYRYIMVLSEDAARLYTAYSLRAPGQKGIHLKVFGSLVGQLLLRTFGKAERVYNAMKLRGFDGEYSSSKAYILGINDLYYIVGWSVFFISARLINIPTFLGNLITGVIK